MLYPIPKIIHPRGLKRYPNIYGSKQGSIEPQHLISDQKYVFVGVIFVHSERKLLIFSAWPR
jgi:hypothetical protein